MTLEPQPTCLRFGDYLLDPADERLIGPAGPVRIGNKAYRVLAALAASRGRLLTKDELFETVWDGTVVSESALTSVVKELRQALADDTRSPRYIESVYGRGYRFLPEVVPAEPPGRGGTSAPPSPAVPALVRRGLPGWRRWRWPALALLLALIAAGAWQILRPPPRSGARIAIEALKVTPGDAGAQLLRQSLSNDLTRMVVGNDATLEFSDAQDAPQGHGTADYSVAGEAHSSAGALQAAVRLVDMDKDTILWSHDFSGPANNLPALRQQMAQKIADVLVCAFGSRSRRPADIDLATLRLFLSGCENYHLDWPAASRFLGQVVARRPDFAQARAMYAAALNWDIGTYAQSSPDQWPAMHAEGLAQASKAIAQDPHVGVAYFVLSTRHEQTRNYPRKLAILRQGLAADPAAPEIHMALGVTLANLGLGRSGSAEVQQAVALDPFSIINIANLAEDDAYRGRPQDSLRLLDQARVDWPGEFYTSWMRFETTARMGDPAKALAMLGNPQSNPGYAVEFPEQWRLFLEARADPARIDANARAIVAGTAGLGAPGIVKAVQDLVQLGRIDDAYRVAAALPPAKQEWDFAWFWPFMAPFRADPRFRAFAGRQDLLLAWSQLDTLPDFCGEPGLKWHCPATPAGWRTPQAGTPSS